MAQQRGTRTQQEKSEQEQEAAAELAEQESNAQSAIDAAAQAAAFSAAEQEKARTAEAAEEALTEVKIEEGDVEEYLVVHPKFNLYLGDDAATKNEETGQLVWPATFKVGGKSVPVAGGWVVIPAGTRLRPSTAKELDDFRLKAGLGFLRPVSAEAP